MLGNMLNDLAEAIRRWTEKNSLWAIAEQARRLEGQALSQVLLTHKNTSYFIFWSFRSR